MISEMQFYTPETLPAPVPEVAQSNPGVNSLPTDFFTGIRNFGLYEAFMSSTAADAVSAATVDMTFAKADFSTTKPDLFSWVSAGKVKIIQPGIYMIVAQARVAAGAAGTTFSVVNETSGATIWTADSFGATHSQVIGFYQKTTKTGENLVFRCTASGSVSVDLKKFSIVKMA